MGKLKTVLKKFLGFDEDIAQVNLDEVLVKKQENFFKEEVKIEKEAKLETKTDNRANFVNKVEHINRGIREEIVMYPKSFADACDVVEHIETGKIVTVNMEDLNLDDSKRIADFVLGAVYVLQGDVEKVGGKSFKFWID